MARTVTFEVKNQSQIQFSFEKGRKINLLFRATLSPQVFSCVNLFIFFFAKCVTHEGKCRLFISLILLKVAIN